MDSSLIMVVDDDDTIRNSIRITLEEDGYKVITARNGQEALNLLTGELPALLILDILMLPGMSGLDVCRLLRANIRYDPLLILFLSSLKKSEEIAQGLDLGADDYLVKDFKDEELSARVLALLRPLSPPKPASTKGWHIGDLWLHPSRFQAELAGREISLTSTEHRLLSHLMASAGSIFSNESLLQSIWGYGEGEGKQDLVPAHIHNLRTKLEADPDAPRYLRTYHNRGYAIIADESLEQGQNPPS